jgi:hypothetical protein
MIREITLTETGARRVLSGVAGMTFEVYKATTDSFDLPTVLHVLDPRFPIPNPPGFQIWTLSGLKGDYENYRERTGE